MNVFKFLWKTVRTRVWMIVTTSVLVLMLAVNIVATQVGLINETMNTLFGGPRQVVRNASDPHFISDYDNKTEVLNAANDLNERIMEEGAVLIKNENNALPLAKGARISVFGKNSVNLVHGGSGSGEKGGAGMKNLYHSLDAAGFVVNPTLKSFYESSASGSGRPSNPSMGDYLWGFATGETEWSSYSSSVKQSYASDYKDAAIVVFSRIAGEGYDLPRSMKTSADGGKVNGAREASDHYLQLDANETELLKEVSNAFDKVVVIINSSAVMDLGFLDDEGHYAFNQNIKAALWIGNPGGTGIMAVGRILNGDVNPSGHLTDTYMRDAKKEPSWENFAFNLVTSGNQYRAANPKNPSQINNRPYYFVDYEEGIYVGYRYWETRGYTEGNDAYADDTINGTDTSSWDSWYNAHVVYPFGHGLSYSNFSWELKNSLPSNSSTLSQDGKITATVRVTNNGTVTGKDVVQLYYTAPYKGAGGIEKSHVVLGAFKKTADIKVGEYEDVEISINVSDMASYDWNDANDNGITGYELEGGDYTIYLAKDAHGWADNSTLKINYKVPSSGYHYQFDGKTGTEIRNLFDDAGLKINSEDVEATGGSMSLLSRADFIGTYPSVPTLNDRTVSEDEFIATLTYSSKPWTEDIGQPWHSKSRPNQSQKSLSYKEASVKLYDLLDENFYADYDNPLWDELLDQLTIEEMKRLIGNGNFHTQAIESIVKPRTIDPDGPVGFTNFMEIGEATIYDTCFYVSATVVASTWNVELAYEQGKMVGNEGLIGNERGDGRSYSGWYAPAVNIHRTPFSGRNWEYYSEDGLISGKIAAGVIQGAQEKGVYTYVKHFALNDQETNRDSNGILTWADEQTMREIYFKPFELAVKEGGTRAIMSSFNRIGKVWAGGSYPLLTELLRNEWGFRGMVITDYNVYDHMPADQMIRAGGDLNLMQNKTPTTSSAALTATQVTLLRQASKNILYTVVNSNAMNTLIGARISYKLPKWTVLMLTVDVVILVGFATWGFFAIRKSLKKSKAEA